MIKEIERWGQYEYCLETKFSGNPYEEIQFGANFIQEDSVQYVDGFYDGNNCFRVRFMPQKLGTWKVQTKSNIPELNEKQDYFKCVPASKNNHGPVRVADNDHFEYADGSSYVPFGTTAYVWTLQSDQIKEDTLETLAKNEFNKIRMTVFPKFYNYNLEQPSQYPYVGAPKKILNNFTSNSWIVPDKDIGFDFTRFNPEFFQNLEKCIKKLDKLGIQADLILFHPYDSWGFARMGEKADLLYLKYIIARVASYKNVWWSLANEYDLMVKKGQKKMQSWDVLGSEVEKKDPFHHLLSIHNWYDRNRHKGSIDNWYDYSKPWITHLSIQTEETFFVPKWQNYYHKPVIVDECRYEGNIELAWGNNSAEGMMDKFYKIVIQGGFATHGEVMIDKPNTKRAIWWSHGGVLRGESYYRINYLKKILTDHDIQKLVPLTAKGGHWELVAGESQDKRHIMIYYGENEPEFEKLSFLQNNSFYSVELIDCWNMSSQFFLEKINNNNFFKLPRKKYQALLLTLNN